MANASNSNTFYIDTQSAASTDDLNEKGIKVTHVVVTSTAANARLELKDTGTSTPTKVLVRILAADTTQVLDFADNPMSFPNGITPSVLTNAIATLVLIRAGS